MKKILLLFLVAAFMQASGQELYPYAEPASNMPAKSVALKNTSFIYGDVSLNRAYHRHMPEVQFGLSKTWMLHANAGFSNMQQRKLRWESARLYAKYRFLSADDVHKHFRMAAFGAATYSRNRLDRNEINLMMGEQSGVQAGLVATQLWNKFALSVTGGWNEVLNNERWDKTYAGYRAFQSISYSVSAGYLLLPFEYKDYNQTNINLYAELIGSRNINTPQEKYYVDLMPSVQAIFNSTAKLNAGYRFEVSSDISRMARNSWLLSFDYLFLNALGKKRVGSTQ